MTDIRYAIVSDLHFGATNSVLTTLTPDADQAGGFAADPTVPTALLEGVLGGLARLTGKQETPPTLILAGDVLDLALSPDEVAATAFGGFVDRAFGTGQPLFAPLVYYIPGNHDHHIWEGTREATYTNLLSRIPPTDPIPPPRHTTDMRPAQIGPSEGDLLSALIRRRPGCGAMDVRVAYPNLALVNGDGSRVQVVSHGHFTESIYRLMSRMRQILFPEQTDPDELTDVETMECENFAWIDFFWSTLGRSGDVGNDVARIYADLQSKANLDVLATNLALAFAARPHNPAWLRRVESGVLGAVLRREVGHVARAERGSPDVTLTANGRLGVQSYIEGAVRAQMLSELGHVPDEMGFVFGHTHKPFADSWDLQGYPNPVAVANTGGWVVDTATAASCQGGAMVLLDDDLHGAVLAMYTQQEGGVAPVKVIAMPEPDGGTNPLAAALADAIDTASEPWCSIQTAAEALVAERWKLQANLTSAIENRKVPPAKSP